MTFKGDKANVRRCGCWSEPTREMQILGSHPVLSVLLYDAINNLLFSTQVLQIKYSRKYIHPFVIYYLLVYLYIGPNQFSVNSVILYTGCF